MRGLNRKLWNIFASALAFLAIAALGVLVFTSISTSRSDSSIDPALRAQIATALVLLPSFGMVVLAMGLWICFGRAQFVLRIPAGLPQEWEPIVAGVRTNWTYERVRFRRALERVLQNAALNGAIASGAVAAALIATNGAGTLWVGYQVTLRPAALAVITAVYAAFGISFARLMVRISAQDFNARMFAWSTRGLVFVILATVGTTTLLSSESGALSYGTAVMVGITAAIFGEQLLSAVVEKVCKIIGVTLPSRKTDNQLRELSDISEEDLDRFAEEGVDSYHALAFSPTSRLFFSTNHSLQRICDWQDQALLRVYLGEARARALFEQVGIRGAIDLQGIAQFALAAPPAADQATSKGSSRSTWPDPTKLREVLQKALNLEEVALHAALFTFAQDEVIRRLRVHWCSTPEVKLWSSASAPYPKPRPDTDESAELQPQKKAA